MASASLERDLLSAAHGEQSSVVAHLRERLHELFGIAFSIYDAQQNQFVVIHECHRAEGAEWLQTQADNALFEGRPTVSGQDGSRCTLTFPIQHEKSVRYVAVGIFTTRLLQDEDGQQSVTGLLGVDKLDDSKGAGEQEVWTSRTVTRLAEAFCNHQDYLDNQGGIRDKIEQLSAQLVHNFEEITLLHQVVGEFEDEASRGQMANTIIHRLPEVMPARGLVIAICDHEINAGDLRTAAQKAAMTFTSVSQCAMTPEELAGLLEALGPETYNSVVVANGNVTRKPSWPLPHVYQLCLVPVRVSGTTRGWIVAFNREDGKEFGSPDVILLKSLGLVLANCPSGA